VLVLLAAGSTARAIARQLLVSPHTIGKHLEHIYTKLGVGDRLSAVSQAHSLGLLPLPVRRTDPHRPRVDTTAAPERPLAAPATRRPARPDQPPRPAPQPRATPT
jgi:hypothetical protein